MSRQITITLPDEMYELLFETATEHNRLVDEFAREALMTGTHSRYLAHRPAQYELILRLSEDGLDDTEIGKRIFLARHKVGELRRQMKLPVASREVIDRHAVRRYWADGRSDSEIAQIMGHSKHGIRLVRLQLKLPARRVN